MNEHYEKIKSNTTCAECGGKDMGFTYLYDQGGIVKKQGTVLGMLSYTGLGDMLMITCRTCGFVAKSFVIKH